VPGTGGPKPSYGTAKTVTAPRPASRTMPCGGLTTRIHFAPTATAAPWPSSPLPDRPVARPPFRRRWPARVFPADPPGDGGAEATDPASTARQTSSANIERCINHLNQWRGIAARYDKTAPIYVTGFRIAGICRWSARSSHRKVLAVSAGSGSAPHPDTPSLLSAVRGNFPEQNEVPRAERAERQYASGLRGATLNSGVNVS
jgi:hypothetical protein